MPYRRTWNLNFETQNENASQKNFTYNSQKKNFLANTVYFIYLRTMFRSLEVFL